VPNERSANFIGYDFSPDTFVVSSPRLKAKSVGFAFAFAFTMQKPVNRDLSLNTESDQVEEFTIFKRIYSKGDICDLLSECGFRIDKIYGGWDLSPLAHNSPKMVLIGGKDVKTPQKNAPS